MVAKVEGLLMRLSLFVFAVVAACTSKNPNLCCIDEADCATVGLDTVQGCDTGLVCRGNQCIAEICQSSGECEASAPYCIAPPDGRCQEACTVDSECPGFGQGAEQIFCEAGACVECRAEQSDCSGSTPFCDAGKCVACALNEQCTSGVCDQGNCIDESMIAYVSKTGSSTSDCSKPSPCDTVERALAQVARPFILIDAGTYSRVGTLTFSGSVRLIGSSAIRPILTRSTAGPIATLDGGVNLTLEHLEVSGATGAIGAPPATVGDGIRCSVGAGAPVLKLKDTVVRANTVDGVESRNCTIEAIGSTFSENGLDGVELIDSTGVIDGCQFLDNTGTGAKFDAGIFEVRNSISARNGSTGFELFTQDAGTKVEFNTLIDNASGFSCQLSGVSGSFPNNIIVRNDVQTVGSGCTFPSSIVLDTDISALNFVSPDTAPFDYHIQTGSLAIDMATITTVDHDFDGDPRPSNAADVGADEL
jgi:hypothetical protein